MISTSAHRSLTVAWISDFPIEWLPDIPDSLRALPRTTPTTWEMVLLDEFEKNAALRLHVIILRKNIPRGFSFERNGVTFHLLKYRGGTRASTLFWLDTILIRRVLRRIKPDLVHAWGSEQGAILVANRLNHPSLLTIQGLLSWYGQVVPLGPYQRFGVWVEKMALAGGRHVSTESKFAAAWLQKGHPHLSVHQIEHAPKWIFHQVRRTPATAPIRFLSNGALGYRKGTDLLLKALDELAPDVRFEVLLIGAPNDPFVAPLLGTASPELRRRLVFKSDLPPAEVALELSKATIFLLPTRADTSPNAVKEAVVAGVPVVAGNVGGIPDYVFPGENGFLFAAGKQAEFKAMIQEAITHPLFSRGLVSPASLQRNREYLSPARMAQSFLSVYRIVSGG